MAHQQVRSSQLSMHHDLSTQPCHRHGLTWHTTLISTVLMLLALSLSGCGAGDTLWDLFHTDDDAEAQTFANDRQRVRTFVIETNSFIIETDGDNDPTPIGTVTVSDNATQYPITANGIVRFIDSTGDPRAFDVESGDRIIERPGDGGTGTLTIIDASSPLP